MKDSARLITLCRNAPSAQCILIKLAFLASTLTSLIPAVRADVILPAILAVLLSATASRATTAIHVLLVGGQSNADGRADPLGLPTTPVNMQNPQEDVPYYYTSPLTTLRPRATQFGPEITFGRAMADFYAPYGEKVAIVKYAAGGTNLHTQWKAGGDASTTGDGTVYLSFQTTINAGLAALQSANPDAILMIEGMIWVQGESDIDAGSAASAAYGANLTRFIADVRATFSPDMPFFLSRISSNQTVYSAPAGSKYNDYLTLRTQQQSVASNVAGAYMIDTDAAGFSMKSDNLHYGPDGQQALGYAFASALQAVVPAPTHKVLNLMATSGIGQVSLVWDAYSGADSYRVKRSTMSGGPYAPVVSGLTSTTYIDSNIVGGESYYYVVTAVRAEVETDDSLPVSAMPTPATNTHAATLTWDPLHASTGSDGNGTWNNGAANFATGGTNVAYTVTPSAVNVSAFPVGATQITVASATGLLAGHGISLTQFPAGTTISNIVGSTVTMSAAATTALASTTSTTFAPIHTAIFGAGTGAAGIVTVSGTQSANGMTINAAGSGNHTFTGGTIRLGTNGNITGLLAVNSSATINSAFYGEDIKFFTTGQNLTFGGGGSLYANINGSNSTIAAASTMTLNPGTFGTVGGGPSTNIGDVAAETGGLVVGGTLNAVGTFQMGNSGNGLVTVVPGGSVNLPSGQNVCVARSGSNHGKLVIAGGSMVLAGTTPLLIGFTGNSNGTVNVTGGTLSVAVDMGIGVQETGGTNTVNLSGGITTVGKINFGQSYKDATTSWGASTGGSGALNITGGSLYVGAGGMVKGGTGTYTHMITLSEGIIGANANWASSLDMVTNGNITFKAANAADAAFNIALSGALSGTGGLHKSGAGSLSLSGSCSYQGDTSVSAGTLALATINSNNESSRITIAASGATLQLDFAGTDTIGKLVIGNNPPAAVGVYGAVGSVSPIIGIPQIAGTGTLTVTSTGGNYASWATFNGIGGQFASDDFDHDGLTNLVEYALGKDPAASSQAAGTFTGGILSFTKGVDAVADGDVTYVIEESTDLITWLPAVTHTAPNDTPTISRVLPAGMTREFARLKVIQIP